MNTSIHHWQHVLSKLAERALGREQGRALCAKYSALANEAYRSLIAPRFALKDMLHLERLGASSCPVAGLLCSGVHYGHDRLHFYSREERYLDEYIPVLENLNFRVLDQVQFTVTADNVTYFIKSFTIKAAQPPCATIAKLRHRLVDAVQAILNGRVDNDALNKLIILTGMAWQEVDVLRAYRNYYLQLANRTTHASIHQALIRNPAVALCLFDFFDARFRPYAAGEDESLREELVLLPMYMLLLQSMERVEDLNDDRILRNLFNLIDATMRSNFHARRSAEDYFIAFKIDSLGVIEMTPPKPQYEIYVHAATMQGIHLRAGKVSRGGIRWSDRPDDFRNEILGLMQTQISKNALIVPTGAKGGFVLTGAFAKENIKTAGKAAYITLIKGLLDLTDNYDDARAVTHPPELVVYDDPDPYLVVAADKGTAHFSDIANQLSKDYHYWLDDAFASGGSHGYNHKSLGITARGAWECVKRHFRELGKDIQTEAFTVVGIGSMDGDVFGNGMLLSPCIRLRAAFSGQHIFIDPSPPDSEAAFLERSRLFEMPGSSWNDYDRTLISKGGGVYLRAAKDIPLSPELKKWLGVSYRSLDGESLIRYLLTAETDLLWLGGIGTYVKAGSEKHEDVGDRANDNVRVDASALRAKVVGEGANLGFTQKARIEYSLLGGRINTDAVDNSAGVDTSDHEVNLKIFLALLAKMNLLAGSHQKLFEEMTPQVCSLVLADNYAQSQ
ncbi:MAG: NAD-glutamate dehydrogenase domain-containing protein, partial [Gammaproteobacteria bacterium]